LDVLDEAWLMQVIRGRTPQQGEEEPKAGFLNAKLLSRKLFLGIMKKNSRNIFKFFIIMG